MFILQLVIIIILCIYLYSLLDIKIRKPKEKKSSIKINQKLFLTKEETRDFLRKDPDNFLNNLNAINKIARGEKNLYNYLDKITEAALDFSGEYKELLQKLMDEAEELVDKTSSKKLLEYGINKERMMHMKGLRFALTRGKIYEFGYPHTRENIIFLSTDYLDKKRDKPNKVLKTILHEIMHIYQRNNGKIYDAFLRQNFWSIVPNPKDLDKRRMNPDLDLDIWEKDGKVYMAKFTSNNPENLNDIDIKGESEYEHPYEYYAYKFSNEITK